jgi:hypothetical protein
MRLAAFPRFEAAGAASHPIVLAGTQDWERHSRNKKGTVAYSRRALQLGRDEEAGGQGGGGFELLEWALANGCPAPPPVQLPESLTLPYGVTAIVAKGFEAQHILTAIKLPATLTRIDRSAFQGCAGLTELTLPAQLVHVGRSALQGCTGLKELTLPSTLAHVGMSAFQGCTGLKELTLPARRAHVGRSAFQGCTGLTELTLPSTLAHLDMFAFYGCTGLTALHLPLSLDVAGMALQLYALPPLITVNGEPCPPKEVLKRIESALEERRRRRGGV